ncbi:adenylate/guanylate cyclase domain-containing protein, partial [bacterium]|nr:adenylate/guanylate cyclase domain-containing protein [bacterium]
MNAIGKSVISYLKAWFQTHLIGVILTALSFLLVILMHISGTLDALELKTLDFLFSHIRGPLTGLMVTDSTYMEMGTDVVLVEVDDEAYRLIPYSFPYPRGAIWAGLVDILSQAGARVITFDIEFDQPDPESILIERLFDRTGFSRIREFLPMSGDSLFGAAIARARATNTEVILASNIVSEPNLLPPQYIAKPVDAILSGKPGTGLVNYDPDFDNISRRYALFYNMHHEPELPYVTLGLASVRAFSESAHEFLPVYQPKRTIWQFGRRQIKPYGYANILINYYGPTSGHKVSSSGHQRTWATFQRYSLANVMDTKDLDLKILTEDTNWMDQFLPDRIPTWVSAIEDTVERMEMMETLGIGPRFDISNSPFYNKIVIIGASVQVAEADAKYTPFYNYLGLKQATPGMEVHANAIQTILHENYIHVFGGKVTSPFEGIPWAQILIILFTAIVTYALVLIKNPALSGLLVLTGVVGYYGIVFGFFTADLFWLPRRILASIMPGGFVLKHPDFFQSSLPGVGESTLLFSIAPVTVIILVFLTNTIHRIVKEQRDKQFYKATFGTYISPELIEQMYLEKTTPELGGESGIRTAFFSDIQDFSRFSEQLSAAQLVELLNEYLSRMTDILLQEGGTLDKYEGDAIVAFFGAPISQPDHARRACGTALKMQLAMKELRHKWQLEGDKWPERVHDMRMRIGINTGEIVTGNMGSGTRMNYTMMGDTVNIASRLESSAKQYGVYIQVGEQTHAEVRDEFEWRFIDHVRVKGKSLAIKTFELLGIKGVLDENTIQLLSLYN